MALKREMLKALGLNDEQIQTIIEGHDETVQALKKERDDYKARAATAEALKAENGDLKKQIEAAKGDTDWKAEYDKLKSDIEAKESLAKIEGFYKSLLTGEHVDERDIPLIMAATNFKAMELNRDATGLKNAEALQSEIREKYKDRIVTEGKKATPAKTPPEGSTPAFDTMNLTEKMVYANQHPNDPAVSAWLTNKQAPPAKEPAKGD